MMSAIFDMDGLLIDTEPLWAESMLFISNKHQIPVTSDFFKYTTGLRISEITVFWKSRFPWPSSATPQQLANEIIEDVITRSKEKGLILPGVIDALELLKEKGVKIGLATSSSVEMMHELMKHFKLINYFDIMISADNASYGKPHPEVYLQAAASLKESPWNCIAFEDSINGMIAAKASRMKVVVVPEHAKYHDERFALADVKLFSLSLFNDQLWQELNK